MPATRLRRFALVAAALAIWAPVAVGGARATVASPATCSTVDPGGGSWVSYGHDAGNSRTQLAEAGIGKGNVGSLTARWKFDAVDSLGSGSISSTPVVADGCVYVTSSVNNGGMIFALNADNGSPVWSKFFAAPSPGPLVGGPAVGSPAVDQGTVFMHLSNPGSPYLVALDDQTGVEKWRSTVATDTADPKLDPARNNTFMNASPLIVNGLVISGFAGYEAQEWSRGGWSIFDESTGALLVRQYAVPDAEYQSGHGPGGASVWGSPAVDGAGGWLYAPTGNPSSAPKEAKLSNSLLKIDLRNRTSVGFGTMVAAFAGERDSYVARLNSTPACQDSDLAQKSRVLSWSWSCGQMDLDFGATPNLFTDTSGHQIIGDLQKSGVYHAVHADTMVQAWNVKVGLPCLSCNAASPATDANGIYVASAPGGYLWSLSLDGRIRWATAVGDGIHYQSVSTANGVVYMVDGYGFLDGWNAATGVPLLKRDMAKDTGDNNEVNQGSSGVSIARHMVFAAVNGWVVAYKAP